MKYLQISEIDLVNNALNFDTVDCHVVGGCDLYTTKAAGGDKKLYKNIERSLESEYESTLKYLASLPPKQAEAMTPSMNLSRDSPFGSLSHISSRRAFAYIIATMNASNQDYEFSQVLKPTDFKRAGSLRAVTNNLDTMLYNLRPRHIRSGKSTRWSSAVSPSGLPTPGGSEVWSPEMWNKIDKEMDLPNCCIYIYDPEDDQWDAEDGALWSYNYFFFNKALKRVCYLFLRGSSMMGYSPAPITPVPSKRQRANSDWSGGLDSGANKRAKYWLGDKQATKMEREWGEDYEEYEGAQFVEEDDDDDMPTLAKDEEDEEGAEEKEGGKGKAPGEAAKSSPGPLKETDHNKSAVRGFSEDVMDSIEV